MSNSEKNRTTVDIYGQQYVILGTESVGHVRLVAEKVDEKMRQIGSKNPSLDTTKLAVLTAVNAVNDYLKIMDRVEQLEKALKEQKELKE